MSGEYSTEFKEVQRIGYDGVMEIPYVSIRPFHLALPVANLVCVKPFYAEYLGCSFGREDKKWIDVNFFGHQLVFHQHDGFVVNSIKNEVDYHGVPVPHFGVVLTPDLFKTLADRLLSKKVTFEIEPYTRFQGQSGEQSTMFFYDPNGYALEFKAFGDDQALFECT